MDGAVSEKGQYSEFFWSVFSRIWTDSPYAVQIREMQTRITPNTGNVGQNNSKYGHFSCIHAYLREDLISNETVIQISYKISKLYHGLFPRNS